MAQQNGTTTTSSSHAELSKHLVQEVAKNNGEIPEKYIYPNSFPEAVHAPDLWRDSLLIDFSLLSSSTPAAVDELAKFRSALSHWGCLQVVNHGIEGSALEELIEVTKQFFTLPLEEKLKISAAEGDLEGYASKLPNALAQTVDWSDRLFLTLHPHRKLQFWPTKPNNFRRVVDEYSKKLATLAEDIYKAMAKSLKLKEECFLNHQGTQGPVTTWFNYYPPCPSPERVLGVRPHTDGSLMTILYPQIGVEGLHVQKDELWYKVPVIPGALIVVLGDLAEVMTNGEFKSVVHRAVTNTEKDRISVATFYKSDNKDEFEALRDLVDDARPQVYKKFKLDDYKRMPPDFNNPRSRLDALKLK